MAKDLILKEVKMNSRELAERTGKNHSNIMRDIRDETKQLEKENLNAGIIFELCDYKDSNNRKRAMYILNEEGIIQIAARYSAKVRRSLILQIKELKKDIEEKSSTEWLKTRKNGKMLRRKKTDAIKDKLIPLAIKQGSKNYGKLYLTYEKLINLILKIDGKRDFLTLETLLYIEFLESLIENVVSEEVEKETYYKDIYKICKKKCQQITEIKSPPTKKYLTLNIELKK